MRLCVNWNEWLIGFAWHCPIMRDDAFWLYLGPFALRLYSVERYPDDGP